MALYRQIYTSLWIDPDALGWTPEEKYFFIFLLTNPQASQCGIYELPLKLMCFETGYNEDTCLKLLKRFEEYGKLKYSRETNELAIKNWLKYNPAKSPTVKSCIKNELQKVKNKDLIGYLYPIDGVSPIDPIEENIKEEEIEIELEGEREEEPAYADAPAPSKPGKPQKHKWGEHRNVLLTDDERQKILDKPDGQEAIDFLSNHRAMKGYPAKSDYLALLKWVFDAVLEQRQKKARLSGGPPRGLDIDRALEDIKAGRL